MQALRKPSHISYFPFRQFCIALCRKRPVLANVAATDNETTIRSFQISLNKMKTLTVLCLLSLPACDALWHGSCATTDAYSVCKCITSLVWTKKHNENETVTTIGQKERKHTPSTSTWGLSSTQMQHFHAFTSGIDAVFRFRFSTFLTLSLPPKHHTLPTSALGSDVAPRWETISRYMCAVSARVSVILAK